MNEDDICLVDYETIHIILQDKRYFLNLTLTNANVSTIYGTTNLIEGFGITNIMLQKRTRFHINDASYFSKSTRNLLGFKDICKNGYHIENMNEGNTKCLYNTSIVYDKKLIVKKLSIFTFRLNNKTIKLV